MVAFSSSSLLFLFLGASVVTGASMLTSDLCSGVRAAADGSDGTRFSNCALDPCERHDRLAFRFAQTSNRSAEGTQKGQKQPKKSRHQNAQHAPCSASKRVVQHALNSGPFHSQHDCPALDRRQEADVSANYGAVEPSARRRDAISAARRRSPAAIALVLAALLVCARRGAARYRRAAQRGARSNPVDAGTLAAATHVPADARAHHAPADADAEADRDGGVLRSATDREGHARAARAQHPLRRRLRVLRARVVRAARGEQHERRDRVVRVPADPGEHDDVRRDRLVGRRSQLLPRAVRDVGRHRRGVPRGGGRERERRRAIGPRSTRSRT